MKLLEKQLGPLEQLAGTRGGTRPSPTCVRGLPLAEPPLMSSHLFGLV
jgi:hypothetical protein